MVFFKLYLPVLFLYRQGSTLLLISMQQFELGNTLYLGLLHLALEGVYYLFITSMDEMQLPVCYMFKS